MNAAFKTYDIRGTYPEEIDEKLFYKIGLIMKELGVKEIAIGRDARKSSDSLHKNLLAGLIDSGVNVIDLGAITSPMHSFFCASKGKMGGMITASHSPKEYNGLKFIDRKGIQLNYEEFTFKIEKLIKKKVILAKKKGKLTYIDLTRDYKQNILSKIKGKFSKRLKVVFDCSNGVGGIPLLSILPELDIHSIILNEKPDGNFPNHGPDQTKYENLEQLQREVLRARADLGVMFDGDGDRCAFIDEKGQRVPLDLAFLVLALEELGKKENSPKILFDLRFSRVVSETLGQKGVKPVIMRVGNPFYKKYMHKDKTALLAGELSGHIMYRENYSIDDGLFASLKMIELLSKSENRLSELIEQYKKYCSSGEISFPVKQVKKVMKAIDFKYKDERELHIDGISVIKKDVWFNIRPSNTEPLIRFDIEGVNQRSIKKQMEEIVDIIKENDKE